MQGDDLSNVFKALGHSVRRTILDQLKAGPKSTGELADHFPEFSRYAIMKHLNSLQEANLIVIRREGRTRMNYLNPVPLQMAVNRWVNDYQSNMASSLTSLKDQIEEEKELKKEGLVHDSFQIEQEILIKGNVEKVFKSLTTKVDEWWAYRLCGPDSKLVMDTMIGEHFKEIAKDGSQALWGTVTFIDAPYRLELNGLLGMSGAVNSAYSFKLEERGDHTALQLSHKAVGLLDPEWGPSHENGWKELLGTFLKEYVEENKRPDRER